MSENTPWVVMAVVLAGAAGFLLARSGAFRCKHRKHFYFVEGYWDVSYGMRIASYQFAWKCLDCAHTETGHVYGGGFPTKQWLNSMEPHQRIVREAEAKAAAQAVVDKLRAKV